MLGIMVRERKHRLPDAAYYGPKTVAITACALDRACFLTDPEVFHSFVEQLEMHARAFECLVPIYCFMPDHLHILIQGTNLRSRPMFAIDEFKLTSAMWLVNNHPEWHWQKDYWDHLIRKMVDWKRQAFYILNNPVRKGLIVDPYEYPLTGSIGYDLREMLADISW